jgi:hypothetical protein
LQRYLLSFLFYFAIISHNDKYPYKQMFIIAVDI